MSKPKNPDTNHPQLDRSVNQGQIDTQSGKHSQKLHADPMSDQSEGAKAEGQPTAMQGRGAGFSRNAH